MARERLKHSQSNPYLDMIHKSKEANSKIDTEFNPKQKENQILVEKLVNISRRKFKSDGNVTRGFHCTVK